MNFANMKQRLWRRLGRTLGYTSPNVVPSYSQEGEDRILGYLFYDFTHGPGVYVDIGAHHPYRFSNTAAAHAQGWRGINVDAQPGSMAPFREARPTDINLEMGVDLEQAVLTFHMFSEPALNTFDAALAKSRMADGAHLSLTATIECRPLASILDQYLPALGVKEFDFLTVDVEGFDERVIRSSDWTRYRPKAVVTEMRERKDAASDPMALFMRQQGYEVLSTLINSVIFVRSDWRRERFASTHT